MTILELVVSIYSFPLKRITLFLYRVQSVPHISRVPSFGKCSLLKYYRGAGEPQKLSARIFVYSRQFMCLNFVDCHNLQKYFNTKSLETKRSKKIQHKSFRVYGILPNCTGSYLFMSSSNWSQLQYGSSASFRLRIVQFLHLSNTH